MQNHVMVTSTNDGKFHNRENMDSFWVCSFASYVLLDKVKSIKELKNPFYSEFRLMVMINSDLSRVIWEGIFSK